jgi:hypothetical protein
MVETKGKVRHPGGFVRVYFKGALGGRPIARKPGVNRQSEKVLRRNEMARKAWEGPQGCPALAGGGVPWDQFVAGLRKCARERGLGEGRAKTREYRIQFNKYAKQLKVGVAAPAVAAAPVAVAHTE